MCCGNIDSRWDSALRLLRCAADQPTTETYLQSMNHSALRAQFMSYKAIHLYHGLNLYRVLYNISFPAKCIFHQVKLFCFKGVVRILDKSRRQGTLTTGSRLGITLLI